MGVDHRNKLRCTCSVFRNLGNACFHTQYISSMDMASASPAQGWCRDGDVVPIMRSDRRGDVKYFWVNDAFVHVHGGDKLKCSRSGHGQTCDEIAAVKAFCASSGWPLMAAPVEEAEDATGDDATPAFAPAVGDSDAQDAETGAGFDGDAEPDGALEEEDLVDSMDCYPYPAEQQDIVRMHRLLCQGVPLALQPPLPDHACRCGLQYGSAGYHLVNEACAVYCDFPVCQQVRGSLAIGSCMCHLQLADLCIMCIGCNDFAAIFGCSDFVRLQRFSVAAAILQAYVCLAMLRCVVLHAAFRGSTTAAACPLATAGSKSVAGPCTCMACLTYCSCLLMPLHVLLHA